MALAKALGMGDASIINWENNKNDILAENLVKIAKYFGVTTDWLLGLQSE